MIESTLPKACGHKSCIQELQRRIYSLNDRIKEMVQKRISIVHADREVEILHRLLDGIAYALLEAHEMIKYDNK